jgi:hypothetical protein
MTFTSYSWEYIAESGSTGSWSNDCWGVWLNSRNLVGSSSSSACFLKICSESIVNSLVYLKNGSVIGGEWIFWVPLSSHEWVFQGFNGSNEILATCTYFIRSCFVEASDLLVTIEIINKNTLLMSIQCSIVGGKISPVGSWHCWPKVGVQWVSDEVHLKHDVFSIVSSDEYTWLSYTWGINHLLLEAKASSPNWVESTSIIDFYGFVPNKLNEGGEEFHASWLSSASSSTWTWEEHTVELSQLFGDGSMISAKNQRNNINTKSIHDVHIIPIYKGIESRGDVVLSILIRS